MPYSVIFMMSIAAMSMMAAFFFLMLGVGKLKDRPTFFFSLLCIDICIYILLMADVSQRSSVNEHYLSLILQGVVLSLFFFLLHRFFAAMVGMRNLWLEVTLIIIYGFLALYSVGSGSGYWFSEITSISRGEYSWGEVYYQPLGRISWTYYLSIFAQQLIYLAYFFQLLFVWFRKRHFTFLFLVIDLFALNVVAIYDKGIDFGLWDGPYLSQYILILFLFVMGFYLLLMERRRFYHLNYLNHRLEYREGLLKSILDSLNEAVLVIDHDANLIMANPKAAALLQLQLPAALGKRLGHIRPFSLIDEKPLSLQAIFDMTGEGVPDGGREQKVMEVGLQIGQDRLHVLASTAVLQAGKRKTDRQRLFVIRDLTEEVSLEERLKQAQKMEAVGRLAGGVAHDFNNMLGGIIGYSELLLDDSNLDEVQRGHTRAIYDASVRASSLTEKLLSFSRKGERQKQVFAINPMIEELEDLLKRTVDKRVAIEVTIPENPLFCSGDAGQMFNALLNLAINGADAMPEGGLLSLRLTEKVFAGHHRIQVEVEDSGIGIPEKLRKKIFEPFVTTKPEGKGTGLGLASVFRTIQDHSGQIELQTELGKGTCFTLTLPKSDKLYSDKREQPASDTGEIRHGRVLVVDDEPLVRKMITAQLEKSGFSVLGAENGKEALELFRMHKEEVTLLVLDLVLPDFTGRELAREFEKRGFASPLLFSSGYDDSGICTERSYPYPCGFLRKPYTRAQLLREINKLTESR